MKKKDNNNNGALIKEWTSFISDTSSVWLTSELMSEVARQFHKFFTERAERYYDIDEFGLDSHLVESIRPLFQFLYHQYWRISVFGAQNIPSSGRALIVANHSGAIPVDGIMLNMAVYNEHPASRNVRFLVEDFVYHFPFLGTFISRTGGVRACPENAERLLLSDKLIAVFPEGIKGIGKLFKNRYKLGRFSRGGYVKMAMKTKSPIIPAAIIGAEETYPILTKTTVLSKPLGIPYFPITPTFPLFGPLGIIPLPSKWVIIFGKPIIFDKYKKSDADNNLLIHKINCNIRSTIETMITDGLKKRGSVWG